MFEKIKRWLLQRLPTSMAGRLRAWKANNLIQTYRARVVEHQFGSSRLQVYLSDPLAEGWYDRDWPELPELELLKKHQLQPGARVFDVGAHQGIVAAMLAQVVGATGLVVAVEASPHNCMAARENRRLNNLDQIEIVQAAVADRPGTLQFNAGLNGQIDDGSGAGGRISVEAVTLDGLAEKYGLPQVVFMDIEGAECLALAGASRVLASTADFFVEVHVGCGLEKLSGSLPALLSHFPTTHFDLLVRSEADTHFRPLLADDPLTLDRFFLVALSKRPSDNH